MKKIIGLILAITLTATGFIFAHGNDFGKPHKKQQNFHKEFKGKKHNKMMKAPGCSLIEIKEISGEIVVKEKDFPAIKSENRETKIMLPPDVVETLKLNTGSKISIKGIELPAFKKSETDEKMIKVFELQYDGRKFMVFNKGPGNVNRDDRDKGPRK